jgi:AraC family transcriptional regulator
MNTETGYQEYTLYSSRLVQVGAFRLQPWYPQFEEAGEIREGHLIVFPRTSVFIQQEGREPILTDPNIAVFYNHYQPYRRKQHSKRGDQCEYFVFNTATLIETFQPYLPDVGDHPAEPFQQSHTPIDAQTYLLQRKIVTHLEQTSQPDLIFVEEASLQLLERTISQIYLSYSPGPQPRSSTRLVHRRLAQQAKAVLSQRYQEHLSIDLLARELFVSPYHLCRVFRRETGQTIHAYLEQIRLRVALEYLVPGNGDLTRLALAAGFSSHSHFTQAVRKTFGFPPTRLVEALYNPQVKLKLSKILTA